jgi:hypothetical protein
MAITAGPATAQSVVARAVSARLRNEVEVES